MSMYLKATFEFLGFAFITNYKWRNYKSVFEFLFAPSRPFHKHVHLAHFPYRIGKIDNCRMCVRISQR